MKKIPKITAVISFFLCIILFTLSAVTTALLPQTYLTEQEQNFSLSSPLPMVAKLKSGKASLHLFGCIPISTANVQQEAHPQVVVGGTPFGIKLMAKGVLVVGMGKVETAQGTKNPGKDAGLHLGDLITNVNGNAVTTNKELQTIVANGKGTPLTLTVEKNGKAKQITLQPVYSVEGVYRIGIWVRDSTAGLGTLTFYHPDTATFGGLGHGVCDADTGNLLSLKKGDIVYAQINGVRKGTAGTPGEIKGSLVSGGYMGNLQINCNHGVFGTLENPLLGETLPLAFKQEVEKGEATLYSSVSGTKKGYACRIEKINSSDNTTQNMVITVTDPQLLALTGGIVQGMSGSPLVQKGKLVGAVTHVFVNNPAKGYAVFAETMWQTAKSLTNQTQPQEKKAS